MSEFRKRVLVPLSVPLTAMVFIAILVFFTSRILLAVPEAGSTIVALILAIEILVVAAALAAVKRIKAAQRGLMILAGVGLIAAGGASAAIGVREVHGAGLEIILTAKDIKFDLPQISLPVDEHAVIKMVNADAGIPHNVVITSGESGDCSKVVFGNCSELITGVATKEYEVEGIPAGTYTFFCSAHPGTMQGKAVVGETGEGAGGHGEQPGGGGPKTTPAPTGSANAPAAPATDIHVLAEGFKFDVATLNLKAGAPITIDFENKDSAPHNIAIYRTRGGEEIFKGETFSGPASREYRFTAPPQGTYYFQCDVHPNMSGEAKFS